MVTVAVVPQLQLFYFNFLYCVVLQVPALDAGGYFPFIDWMESRYNRVSANQSSRELKKKLRINGLEKMREESTGGPLHAYQSRKLIECIFV